MGVGIPRPRFLDIITREDVAQRAGVNENEDYGAC